MQMNRRELLRTAGMAAVAGALTAASTKGAGKFSAPLQSLPVDLSDWASIRSQFELDPAWIHMALLLIASNPRPVREGIEALRAQFEANPCDAWENNWAKSEEEARLWAARYLGADPSEIALTGSTTMGLGALYSGIKVAPEQEILVTTHDHYSTYESLRIRSLKSGIPVRRTPLYQNPALVTEDEIVENLRRSLRDNTRVVGVTWVHSSTGVKLPLNRMAKTIAQANRGRDLKDRILFCVDGVHGFGVEGDTVENLGCDFFAAGCHKWLFGPRGTGILWGRKELASEVEPLMPSFSFPKMTWGQQMTPGGFHSFEQRWALPEAFEFHLTIGKTRIRDRIHSLNRKLKEQVAGLPKVTLYTPKTDSLSSGLVCFDIKGLAPNEVVAGLRKRGIIASTTPYKPPYARLTPGILNTLREVELVGQAVSAL